MTSGEATILKLLWDMVKSLTGAHITQRQDFFKHHIEPLQNKMIEIHKDYVAGFQEIRRHLKDKTKPPSDLIDFLKERRRVLEYERFQARDLALEMEEARRFGMNIDIWTAVKVYNDSILGYLSATASVGQFTWYTHFLQGVEAKIRLGFSDLGENVWRSAGITGNPREQLISAIDGILDHRLPRAFQSVSDSYAILKARSL